MSTLSVEPRQTTDGYLAVFAALSEPLRVRMLHMMVHQDGGELPCTALDEALPVGKSTISYHIGILRRAGLINVRKAGRNYFYRLNEQVLERYASGFLDHLRDGQALESDLFSR